MIWPVNLYFAFPAKFERKQDGPSLESSSFLNVSLIYLGPCDPWTLELLDLGTLGPLPFSSTSSYFPLHPLTSSYLFLLLSFGMVRLGGRGSCDIGEWDWRWTFDLYIDLKMLWGGWVEPWDLLLPSTFSSSNLLPPPIYSSQLLLPPPKPPPDSSYLLLKDLRWLISSYMKRFQCYSAQKSFMGGGWWWVTLQL